MNNTARLEGRINLTDSVRDAVAEVMSELSYQPGHNDVTELGRKFGIQQTVRADIGHIDAYIERMFGGLRVTLNKQQSPERQRFSFAHELGHILLGDHHGHRDSSGKYDEREQFCNSIAVEILMPSNEFVACIDENQITVGNLERLASHFGTSIESTARRLTELSSSPLVASFWDLRRSGPRSYPALRNATRCNWPAYPRLPRNFVPRPDSSPALASRVGEVVSQTESLTPFTGPAIVESKRYGSYVLSLIQPTEAMSAP